MLQALIVFFLLVCSVSVTAKEAIVQNSHTGAFIEGKHYSVLEQPLSQATVPVVEFMYYRCKGCFDLAPAVAEWSYAKKIDVALVPAHAETAMVDEARMFHTFEVMGVLKEMYEEGYVIFQSDSSLQGKERINASLAEHGVDKEKFWQLWNSDAVNQRMATSAALTKQVKVIRTPTFVVHGKYKVHSESLKSGEELFLLLEYLVAKKSTPTAPPSLLRKAG
jgi:protein dithiol oxidoreductase (disulfide-forming)